MYAFQHIIPPVKYHWKDNLLLTLALSLLVAVQVDQLLSDFDNCGVNTFILLRGKVIKNSLDTNQVVAAIFFDLSKAFDTVEHCPFFWHEYMCSKLIYWLLFSKNLHSKVDACLAWSILSQKSVPQWFLLGFLLSIFVYQKASPCYVL